MTLPPSGQSVGRREEGGEGDMACAGPHRNCQADAHPGRCRTRNSRAGADTIGVPPAITIDELEHAGVRGRPQLALADTHWNEDHIEEVVANKHVQVFIPPESRTRDQPRPGWTGGRYDWMRAVLNGGVGQQLYRNRSAMIEPVFGNTKHNRSVIRFLRRGRSAVRTERLLMATHNLAKLHRHRQAIVGA